MANKSNSSKNFFENMLDAQQQAVETLVENTKKFTNGNTLVNETIEKGTEFFKKAVDSTKETINKVTGQAETVKEEVKNTSTNLNDFFTNWQNQQKAWATQIQDMNKNFLSGMNTGNNFQNPMQNWQNMSNMWNMTQNNPMQTWMNSMNPSNMQAQMDQATEQVKAFWNQLQTILNTNYSDLAKNFQNGTLADSYKGMFNMTEGYAKFYEMWMPMLKSMSEKTFNMDVFNQSFDMSKYKEFMDQYFTFMPQGSQDYFTNLNKVYTEAMKNGAAQGTEMFNNLKNSMNNMMPNMFGNPFTSMLSQYNNTYSQMMNAVSPFAKLMTPNADTKTAEAWNNILNNMNIYNLKSAEMQYMVYQTGTKVMEKIAENVMHKIENGEDVNSMMKLYQEWLNTSDATYVSLFETDEYSKLMAEVSSLQLRIKKDVQLQMETMFANVPVATRSEMDEVYQTIYDLKKEVRQLQSMLELDSAPVTTKKATAKKK
ncbi:MAG: hypothetical protein JNJ58_12965 [Chitinophagaceae bacterium]|nr:hypothetical protein [Chitinophagaceae bacterium]